MDRTAAVANIVCSRGWAKLSHRFDKLRRALKIQPVIAVVERHVFAVCDELTNLTKGRGDAAPRTQDVGE